MACSGAGTVDSPPLASSAPREVSSGETPFDGVESIPVPPADGPRLAPLDLASPVYANPDKEAEKIGYLRIGAQLARSEKSVSMRDCPHGWYAVRPLGFVCAEENSTLNLEAPLVRAFQIEPDRTKALPYAYAFATMAVPHYMRVPSGSEQREQEPGLDRHLRGVHAGESVVGVGANDAPPGRKGLALGPSPRSAPPRASGSGPGGEESEADTLPWWLRGHRQIPSLAAFEVPPGALVARSARPNTGVALIGSFVSDDTALTRRFAVTTDGRLLPADKLRDEPGSTFRGHDVRALGLPVAFGWRSGARVWSLERGRLVPGRALARREFVELTGKARDMGGARMVEARDLGWLRRDEVRVAAPTSEQPWFASAGHRWIDVSIEEQTWVLWEGDTPVYATLVSTGKDGLGDPERSLSTPRGIFRVLQKHVTTTLDSTAGAVELRDVPWVMYFEGSHALHGAYWHDDFGSSRSHAGVSLSPIDARYVFEWSLPNVPDHWHAAYASSSFGNGTLIRIGP
jgi:hypothetical protein